jgi:16S rRNA G1207 methylase RsmC
MDGQGVRLGGWQVGGADSADGATGAVAFTAGELDAARPCAGLAVSFADAVSRTLPRAPRVRILVPPYRGMRLIPLLAWLVAERLAEPGAEVTWLMTKQQGPNSVRTLLAEYGWDLAKAKTGKMVALTGAPPAAAERPEPRAFTADLGARSGIVLAADYGVFSPDHVDAGTALLLEVALAHHDVPKVADIGVGYGPLAIGLVLNGVAEAAVGSDVDAIALWLAAHNAGLNGIPLEPVLSADPRAVGDTALTVCNVPTHISAEATAELMAALVARARHGRLLTVVHRSLEARYTRYLAESGRVDRFPGSEHVVLGVG